MLATQLSMTLFYPFRGTKGSPHGTDVKENVCNVGDPSLIPGSGRSSGGGHGNPLQYSCLENSRGERSVVCYSPEGCKESDMIESKL